MPYLLAYDIRGTNNALRLRLNRKLHQCRAEQIQQSVWKLENLKQCRALVISLERKHVLTQQRYYRTNQLRLTSEFRRK